MRSCRLFVITGLTLGVGLAALALTMDAQTRRPSPPDAATALQQTPAEKAAQQAMWEEFVSLRESRASKASLQDWAKKYDVKLDISRTTLTVTRTLAAPGGSEPPRDLGVAELQKC